MERADLDGYDMPQEQKDAYLGLFNLWKTSEKMVNWNNISPAPSSLMIPYSDLSECPESDISKLLDRLVIVKLNGGLGTTMKCAGPKSCLELRDETAFLDAIIMQIMDLNTRYNSNVPLVLMNSFRTETETNERLSYLKSKNVSCRIETFIQSAYPRLDAETLKPISASNPECWFPPGHGDIINGAFLDSGLPQKFLAEGRDIIFISNSDNLGAFTDLRILNFFANSEKELLTEQTDKSKNDLKGGTLVMNNGKMELLELAMVPRDHIADFEDVKTFKTFNTNNIWIKSEALIRKGKTELIRSIISNFKVINDENKMKRVLQLEIAMGSAVTIFDSAAVIVNRDRFLPVKKWQDVLLLSSDLFTFKHGNLVPVTQTMPEIRLSDSYDSLDAFKTFFVGIPSLINCKSLKINGTTVINRGVVFTGDVEINGNGTLNAGIYTGSISF